jgi:hypothetical protein
VRIYNSLPLEIPCFYFSFFPQCGKTFHFNYRTSRQHKKMQLQLLTRFLGTNVRIIPYRCLSASSIIHTTTKPSILLVNHGYPPLFNAGSEVKIKFYLKNRKKCENKFRFIHKH